jgi:hypothetical protein
MSRRYPAPLPFMTSFTCGVSEVYDMTSCTVAYSPHRLPTTHAQCAYCRTRYYLSTGDRMNCTQCGAPL